MKARPNIHGNSYDDFVEAYHDLDKAGRAMREAIWTLNANVLHGRNYVGVDDPVDARAADLACLKPFNRAIQQIAETKLAILDAIKD